MSLYVNLESEYDLFDILDDLSKNDLIKLRKEVVERLNENDDFIDFKVRTVDDGCRLELCYDLYNKYSTTQIEQMINDYSRLRK